MRKVGEDVSSNNTYRRKKKTTSVNIWIAVLICLVCIELGGYLGIYLSRWEQLKWSGVALEIGTENPWYLNTALHDISILFRVRFNTGSLLGLCLGLGIYGMLRRR
ncbi:MAG: hypothetical protein FWF06_06775 [Symbiobacteriaceae bacterium]|nr:hypothetical protein [Symbiobacteriaceae bacterium]